MTKLVNGTCNLKLIIIPPTSRHFCLSTVLALISFFSFVRLVSQHWGMCPSVSVSCRWSKRPSWRNRAGKETYRNVQTASSLYLRSVLCNLFTFFVMTDSCNHSHCVVQHQTQNARDPPLSFTFHRARILWCQAGRVNGTKYSLLIADVAVRVSAAVGLHQHFTRVFYVLSFGMNYGKFYW